MMLTMSSTVASASVQRGYRSTEVASQRGPKLFTPLMKPLGAQMRGLHTLAASYESRPSASQMDPAAPSFVRPDCPPVSDDESSIEDTFAVEDRFRAKAYSGKPKFRSALEQVSWMTATSAQADFEAPKKNGRLGLGLFGL